MRSPFLALSLAGALALTPALAQAQGSGPVAPDWLVGEVHVTFASVTDASVVGAFAVHRATFGGTTYTAQDLRDAYAQASRFGGGEDFLAFLEGGLASRLEANLFQLFPRAQASLDDVEVDPASLAPAPGGTAFDPPVRVVFRASAHYDLGALGFASDAVALDEEAVRAVLEIGAAATLPYSLSAQPGWNVTYTITMPSWVRLEAADGGSLRPDGSGATWEIHNWQGVARVAVPASLTLRAREAPLGGQEEPTDAHITLSIDMQDVVGLTLPGAAAGDFGALAVRFDALVVARSLRLEDFPILADQLEERLPAALSIATVNADGLRLAAREGLLPPDALDRIEAYFRSIAEQRLAGLARDGAELRGGFIEGTLDAAHISKPVDGDPPLTYRVNASFQLPLAKGPASRLSAAGVPLLTRALDFDLPRVRGIETTYRVLLPPGIALQGVDAEGARWERGSEGGRDVVVVTPEGDGASATFVVAVTSDFVLAKFWYLWLGLLLVGVLVGAALLGRKLRKRPKPAEAEAPPESPEPLPVEAAAPAASPASEGPAEGPRPDGGPSAQGGPRPSE